MAGRRSERHLEQQPKTEVDRVVARPTTLPRRRSCQSHLPVAASTADTPIVATPAPCPPASLVGTHPRHRAPHETPPKRGHRELTAALPVSQDHERRYGDAESGNEIEHRSDPTSHPSSPRANESRPKYASEASTPRRHPQGEATTPAAYHPVVIRRILFAGLLVLQAACAGPAPSVAPEPPPRRPRRRPALRLRRRRVPSHQRRRSPRPPSKPSRRSPASGWASTIASGSDDAHRRGSRRIPRRRGLRE